MYRFLSAIALYTSCTILCLLWLLLLIRQKKVFGRTQIGNRKAGWLMFFPPPLLHVFSLTPAFSFWLAAECLSLSWEGDLDTTIAFLLACSWNRVLYDDKIHVLESLLLSMSHCQSLVIPCSSLSSQYRPCHCRRWNQREEEGGVVHYGAWGSLKIFMDVLFGV